MVWELEKETGILAVKTYNGKDMWEYLDNKDNKYLAHYDLGKRHWHHLPDGAFAAHQAVLDCGLDPALCFEQQNKAEFRKIRSPVMTESNWDHLINLHNLVED
jgi:hypothetical protein